MAGSLIGCLLSFAALSETRLSAASVAGVAIGIEESRADDAAREAFPRRGKAYRFPSGASDCCADGSAEGWVLSGDVTEGRYYGTAVANGCLGMMSSRTPFATKSVMLSNVYDGKSRHGVSRIAQAPDPFALTMSIDGVRIAQESVGSIFQSLDMRRAVFSSEFARPGKAEIRTELRALRELPYAGLLTVEVKALQDVTIGVEAAIAPYKRFEQLDSSVITQKIEDIPYTIRRLRGRTPQRGVLLCAAACTFADGEEPLPAEIKLRKGQTLRFHILGSVVPETDFADPWNEAERFVIYGLGEGVERLVARHEEQWFNLWRGGDIIIDGDSEAQLFARKALFDLYSNIREGRASSIPPFGLSDREYCGHIFWDSELWMYPPLLFLNFDLARSMVDYRTSLLEGARHKAASYGYRGAMFPWESDNTGDESCPTNALTGTFEHHISSDVAIGIWNYFRMTGDLEWLRAEGWPVLRDVAEFWVSRAERNADGSYSIRGVVGADEFAHHVTDNAFTNASAVIALNAAIEAAEILGRGARIEKQKTLSPAGNASLNASPSADKSDALSMKRGQHSPKGKLVAVRASRQAEQIQSWEAVASGLRILKREDGVTDEYEGYDGRTIKQADVNLLAYPLQIVTDPADIRRDLEYYEPRIHPHGPAMSQAILALEWARLGDGQKAWELYCKGLEGHLHGPFLAFSETAGHGDICFMTGLGGFLQLFINGFCGLELTDDGIVQLPAALPPHWRSITVQGAGLFEQDYTNYRAR